MPQRGEPRPPLDAPAGTPLALLCRRPDGSAYSCVGQTLESDPPRLLRWRAVSDRFDATSTYRLEPCGEGTRVAYGLQVEALHRLAAPLAGAAQTSLSMHHAADLRRLKAMLDARMEAPEPVAQVS
ncbi:MAG TPA: hypothetical protein VHI93_07160 [Candidatus Thermoplasmatota archaeon]|nr:hypothetical protein [Candidatus Thermoplasmatota archaeon]